MRRDIDIEDGTGGDHHHRGQDIKGLDVEAVTLRADGDSRAGQRERGPLRKITREPEQVQGQRQGRHQHQDGGGTDARPDTDTDHRNLSGWGGGAAQAARAATRVGPKGTWTLDKDKLKRQSMYKAEGTGHTVTYKSEGAGC